MKVNAVVEAEELGIGWQKHGKTDVVTRQAAGGILRKPLGHLSAL